MRSLPEGVLLHEAERPYKSLGERTVTEEKNLSFQKKGLNGSGDLVNFKICWGGDVGALRGGTCSPHVVPLCRCSDAASLLNRHGPLPLSPRRLRGLSREDRAT